MQRLVVVGTSGSGKTTLAMRVADKLRYPFIELDALFWKPNWVQEEKEIFRQKVNDALSGSHWTVAGNYSSVRELTWTRADTLVWLDYPLGLILWRLLRRTLGNVILRKELFSGNRETWYGSFLAKDNLFLFALKTHFQHRRKFPSEFQRTQYQHLEVLHFTRPQQAEHWLQAI
ncbi:MAG: shikimate kinase [Caldilineaceae bacterium]